jgi:hypothetical protein
LPYNKNNISIELDGLLMRDPESILYQYWLEGLESTWSPAIANATIFLSNLPAGSYKLHVRTIDELGNTSDEQLLLLEITPPFWQTWWFRLLIVMFATGAIYWFLKNREKRINERNQYELQMTELKLKALQSQMNPHFLFNSLNSVQNYILTNRGIEGAKYLSKFSKLVRKIMENSNHQFLRFEEIIETLKMYVEIESFRFNHEFHYEFDIENDEFIFVINQQHSTNTNIIEIIKKLVKHSEIHIIPNHKKGPVYTLKNLDIKDDEEVIVTYCDNPYLWDYNDFKESIKSEVFRHFPLAVLMIQKGFWNFSIQFLLTK